jgi:hypothetical protein
MCTTPLESGYILFLNKTISCTTKIVADKN